MGYGQMPDAESIEASSDFQSSMHMESDNSAMVFVTIPARAQCVSHASPRTIRPVNVDVVAPLSEPECQPNWSLSLLL